MKADLERRVRKLEETHNPEAVPVVITPLTDAEMEGRWQELQRRAAQGDRDAHWRVERINFFIERAKERHDESQRTRERS